MGSLRCFLWREGGGRGAGGAGKRLGGAEARAGRCEGGTRQGCD